MKRLIQEIRKVTQAQPILKNRRYLQARQRQQFQFLQRFCTSQKTDDKYINMKIQQMQQLIANDQSKQIPRQIFCTFAKNVCNAEVKKLNAIADLNPKKIIQDNNFGIPFTVKDHVKVDSMIQTCGFSHNITPANQTADVVKILQQNNCVPYAQTNIPQGLLGIQSNNHVYGCSKNPWKKGFISGGSSGGDGTAVSTNQCAFAVCTDSAGSARIPASFCGIYGFKPSGSSRISLKGRLGVSGTETPLFKQVNTSIGFMARSIQDLKWLCQKTLGKTPKGTFNPYLYNQWDQSKYQETMNKKKLKIGYIINQPQIATATSISNTMKEVIQILINQGHQIVQFQFYDLIKFSNFFFDFFAITGFFEALYQRLGGQQPANQLKNLILSQNYSKALLKAKILLATSNQQAQFFRRFDHTASSTEFFPLMKQKDYLKQKFLKIWNSHNVDFLLSPTMPFTAPMENNTQRIVQTLHFGAFHNILELPAGNIPVRKVKNNETSYIQGGFFQKQINKLTLMSQGLPICLQLTSMRMEDQKCIAGMKHIQKCLQKNNLGYFSEEFHNKGKVMW